MLQATTFETIPGPRPRPIIGNLPDVLRHPTMVQGLMHVAARYGPFFRLELIGDPLLVASGYECSHELCDDDRFEKALGRPVLVAREFVHDALFTAYSDEPNWKKAHNILLPNFAYHAMRDYHSMMESIAVQLLHKWEMAAAEDKEVDVTADMTRLTFDTIGLCGFDCRFNSFERSTPHPFVESLTAVMDELQRRVTRPDVINRLMNAVDTRFNDHMGRINRFVDDVIAERRKSGDGHQRDLLACMLQSVDRETGEKLDDLNIRYQVLTFLVAGHDSTSGLLAFALYLLIKHPAVLERACAEVDEVLGSDTTRLPDYATVGRLRYVDQIIKETLRLWPTAPGFARKARQDDVIANRYRVRKGEPILHLSIMVHRDPRVWGDDADQFNPDHFSPEREAALPPDCFKPFGTGPRGCIGQQFALQESKLVLALLLQRFQFVDSLRYQLQVRQALFIRPGDFRVRLRVRQERRVTSRPAAETPVSAPVAGPSGQAPLGTTLLVLYGSNMGTCEGVARRMAQEAQGRGIETSVAPLDSLVGRLPEHGNLLVVCSSYNGTPPDNAAQFCQWIQSDALRPGALSGLRYAVLGCGHHDWAATYQKIPRLIDARLEALGAVRLVPRGEADGGGDFDADVERWGYQAWHTLAQSLGMAASPAPAVKTGLEVEVIDDCPPNPFVASFDARTMVVVENREMLGAGADRSVRHIEIALPEGVHYTTGDHLGVIPENDAALVQRAADRFNMSRDTRLRLKADGDAATFLPTGQVVSAFHLLTQYVELQDVATRRDILTLAGFCTSARERDALNTLAQDDQYTPQVLLRRRSILDLLEDFPSCDLPFARFLDMLPSLRPRYYSISSSPLFANRICSITVGVLKAPALSGHGQYVGTCSSWLAERPRGSTIHAFVRDNGSSFRLPRSPQTPIVMVGPGTGVAPFRGFLQERAVQMARGQKLGDALLFFGCRSKNDHLYEHELNACKSSAHTVVVVAYSRAEGQPKTYVQNRIVEEAERVWTLLSQGAVVYVCGEARRMAPEVRRAFMKVHQTKTGGDEAAAEQWLNDLVAAERYLEDVWPG